MRNQKTASGLHAINTAGLAKLLDVTCGHINILVFRRVLTRGPDGSFDVAEAVPAFVRHLKRRLNADREARARLTEARASLAELKLERLRRHLNPENQR